MSDSEANDLIPIDAGEVELISLPPIDEWLVRLEPFIRANPNSALEYVQAPSGPYVRVVAPWNDASLALRFPKEPEAMIEALNNVLLPERFIALWHLDTALLEVIWTAFTLPDVWKEIDGRKFEFRYRGISYECEFTDSSNRLLAIAAGFQPLGEGNSRYRNLPAFAIHASAQRRRASPGSIGKPLSFWIRGIREWDETQILDLANHLNFYLGYYDSVSPVIEIQTPRLEAFLAQPQRRYRADHFPRLIAAQGIDDVLLHFWHASRTGDTARRFLYSYRIIEYISFSYVEASIRSSIRRSLSAPNALDDIAAITEKVINAMTETKVTDPQKFDAVIRAAVKPEILWPEIEQNVVVFSTETRFDGGLTIPPIAKPGWRFDDFATNGISAFAQAVRSIRNALSHGRDQRTTLVITPTPHNFQRLQPWAALMAVAAGEVVLYGRDS
jgi:hypothetical protein